VKGKVILGALLGTVFMAAGGQYVYDRYLGPADGESEAGVLYAAKSIGPQAVEGVLNLSVYGPSSQGHRSGDRAPLRQTSVFYNNHHYSGMEDNDLRGFLDGRFKYGWNQPTQVHVRVGRRAIRPRYGELELFRVIQRWADLKLPAESKVLEAKLEILVEEGPSGDLELMLYAVKKDWNPGQGGVERNNTSPPQEGEVWWLEAAHQKEPWGLPGVGFASDDHPQADTGAMPLASARYSPGLDRLTFSSPALARYVEGRVRQGQPLLFLLKLNDYLEDQPGTVLTLYSGNHGDDRNPSRRPRLRIDWESPAEVLAEKRQIFLEHGRALAIPRIETRQASYLAVSFDPAKDREAPFIQVRGGRADQVSPWEPFSGPRALNWDWIEVRLEAAQDPLVRGQTFVSQFRDTWVITDPPEKQRVRWTFISPSQKEFQVEARYLGDYRWQVSFQPQELGRWKYHWTQNFAEAPYRSATGVFDVTAGDEANIERQLRRLLDQIKASGLEPADKRTQRLGIEFARLERRALQLQTPDSFRSQQGRELMDLLTEVRNALGGAPVPKPLEPVAMKREW